MAVTFYVDGVPTLKQALEDAPSAEEFAAHGAMYAIEIGQDPADRTGGHVYYAHGAYLVAGFYRGDHFAGGFRTRKAAIQFLVNALSGKGERYP